MQRKACLLDKIKILLELMVTAAKKNISFNRTIEHLAYVSSDN